MSSISGYSLMSSVWSNLQSGSTLLSSTSQSGTGESDADLGASLSDAIGSAYDNQIQGAVTLAADEAAKRMGVSLPSSSGSTSTGSATTASSANKASDVTTQRVSGIVNSPYGSNYAAQDITGTLAALDDVVAGIGTTTPARAASSYGSNLAAQDITGFLANLDALSATPVDVTA